MDDPCSWSHRKYANVPSFIMLPKPITVLSQAMLCLTFHIGKTDSSHCIRSWRTPCTSSSCNSPRSIRLFRVLYCNFFHIINVSLEPQVSQFHALVCLQSSNLQVPHQHLHTPTQKMPSSLLWLHERTRFLAGVRIADIEITNCNRYHLTIGLPVDKPNTSRFSWLSPSTLAPQSFGVMGNEGYSVMTESCARLTWQNTNVKHHRNLTKRS